MPASKNQSGARGIRKRRCAHIVGANSHASKSQTRATRCRTPRIALGMRTSRPRKYGESEIGVNTRQSARGSDCRLQSNRTVTVGSLCVLQTVIRCAWVGRVRPHPMMMLPRGAARFVCLADFMHKSWVTLSFYARHRIAIVARARGDLRCCHHECVRPTNVCPVGIICLEQRSTATICLSVARSCAQP